MNHALRRRFWLETGMAVLAGVVLVITLVRNDWIEIVFGVDPDSNNGSLEKLIVIALLVVTITLLSLASHEWRKARLAVS